jgi:hypothetical protein
MLLKRMSPRQWRNRVDAVPLKMRTEVAHVIWWDWFAGRSVTERWPDLDTFIKRPKWHQPTDTEIVTGLMLCGYSQAYAIKRIGNKNNKGQSKK